MDDVTLWKLAAQLEAPTVADLQRLAGVSSLPEPVFESGLGLFRLSGNVVVKIHMTEMIAAAVAPVGVMLYVAGSALKKTRVAMADLQDLAILGLPQPVGAKQLLDHIDALDPGHTGTATSSGQWEIFYGHAIEFLFTGPFEAATPRDARLVAITRYYTMGFTGNLTPIVERAGG